MTGEESVKEAWNRFQENEYKDMLIYVSQLNRMYRSEKALYELDDKEEGFNWIDNYNAAETVLAYERISKDNEKLLIAVNFTPVTREKYILHVPVMGRYRILLDSSRFGDGGENMHDSKEVICSSIETDVNDKYELSISIPSS